MKLKIWITLLKALRYIMVIPMSDEEIIDGSKELSQMKFKDIIKLFKEL